MGGLVLLRIAFAVLYHVMIVTHRTRVPSEAMVQFQSSCILHLAFTSCFPYPTSAPPRAIPPRCECDRLPPPPTPPAPSSPSYPYDPRVPQHMESASARKLRSYLALASNRKCAMILSGDMLTMLWMTADSVHSDLCELCLILIDSDVSPSSLPYQPVA